MRALKVISLVVGLVVALRPAATLAGETFGTQLVTNEIFHPIWVTAPPGDFERIFVLDQTGEIRIIKRGVLLETRFLDINDIVLGGFSAVDERGLLGLAFHPEYAENGFFYVNYVNLSNNTVVARYQVSADPDVADVGSAQTVITVTQPVGFPNHKGGWIAFGPDSYLYVGMGDGGSANDPGNRAQDITSQLLGKMLRLDVNGDDFPADGNRNYAIPPTNPFVGVDGDDEIWALGLRNPWRNAFDQMTGELYIADVGQDVQEEINRLPAGSNGGFNFGWRCMEGNLCTGLSGCTCNAAALTDPIFTYNHSVNPVVRCSLTGGEVYRGCAIPALDGMYLYSDYCSNEIWALHMVDGDLLVTDLTASLAPGGGLDIGTVSSFGRDAYGELYICDRIDNEVFKIVPTPIAPDCNTNGAVDACDLVDGSSQDEDKSGVPDECEIPFSIVSSNPPNDAIDARQPFELDGTNPMGWTEIELTFSDIVTPLMLGDLQITQEGGQLPAPEAIAALPVSDFSVRVLFNRAIEPRSWTRVTHTPSSTSVRIGSLPADVNADRTSSPVDILAVIDALNGVTPRPIWSTDVDRSGLALPPDILRVIDLLNGAGAFEEFNGATLP